MALTFERYCMEIVDQTDLLRSVITDADLTAPVSTCPGWTIGRLLRHIGGAQRWATAVVASRAQEPLPRDDFDSRDPSAHGDEDPAELDPWLADAATNLAMALSAAGSGVPLWTPVPTVPTSDFYARRFTHETLIHRADATLAVGGEYSADPEVAADAIDEWLELCSLPVVFEYHPEARELLGPGRTLHFHATDVPELNAEWVVDLTGDTITWRRAHDHAAVAVRGPLTDLLLVIYRRLAPADAQLEILGDRGLFEFWLDRVSFG